MSNLQRFWEERIDWQRVEESLNQYPNVAKAYPLSLLQGYKDKKPFYIHPLTRWLLIGGTTYLRSLPLLNAHLGQLEVLQGWDKKKRILGAGQDSNRFWSDLSEIKIAAALLDLGYEVELLEADNQPDLKANMGNSTLFVEVYTFQKFFYRLIEIEEMVQSFNFEFTNVLDKYGASLSVERNIGIPTALSDDQIVQLLDTVKTFVEKEENVAKVNDDHPQIVFQEGSNFQVVLNGEDDDKYVLNRSLGSGNFDGYVEQMYSEILGTKGHFEQLEGCEGLRLGAVETLLNSDMQLGFELDHTEILPSAIDGLVILATSIDGPVDFKKGKYRIERNQSELEQALALT